MGKIIGIDLGTTNSAVAVIDDKTGKIIENIDGKRTTPSIVSYDADTGGIVVGETAKRNSLTNPDNTFYEVKRLIGRRFDDEDVQTMMKQVPFNIVEAENGDAWVEIKQKDGTMKKTAPAEIGAQVLIYLKEAAEDYLGEEVSEAVITVPAYFNNEQRQATKDAGAIAGLEVKRVINEPTAAALAFGIKEAEDKNIIVYDLGGGTFDVSILSLDKDSGVLEVVATDGDTFLGGSNFDERLIDYIADKVQAEHGADLRDNSMSLIKLKDAAEKAKIALSSSEETNILIPFIPVVVDGEQKTINVDMEITRGEYESLVKDLFEATIAPMERALKAAIDSDLNMIDSIDDILMVGGMTRTPMVLEIVKKFSNMEPNTSVNPDEVVAAGASLQGGIMTGELEGVTLQDVIPLSLGVGVSGGGFEVMIPANTAIPFKATRSFPVADKKQTSAAIKIGQGESKQFKNNADLGVLAVQIPLLKTADYKIEVEYSVDENSILHIKATDGEGNAQEMKVNPTGGLTEADIERMKQEAEANKEEDAKFEKQQSINYEIKAIKDGVEELEETAQFKSLPEKAVSEFKSAIKEIVEILESADPEQAEEMIAASKIAYEQVEEKLVTAFQNAGSTNAPVSNDDSKPKATAAKPKTPSA